MRRVSRRSALHRKDEKRTTNHLSHKVYQVARQRTVLGVAPLLEILKPSESLLIAVRLNRRVGHRGVQRPYQLAEEDKGVGLVLPVRHRLYLAGNWSCDPTMTFNPHSERRCDCTTG